MTNSSQDEHDQVGTGIEYLFTLRDCIAVVTSEQKNGLVIPMDSLLWRKAVQFLHEFDPVEVRYAGATWRSIVETVYDSAAVTKGAVRLIWILIATKCTDSCVGRLGNHTHKDRDSPS